MTQPVLGLGNLYSDSSSSGSGDDGTTPSLSNSRIFSRVLSCQRFIDVGSPEVAKKLVESTDIPLDKYFDAEGSLLIWKQEENHNIEERSLPWNSITGGRRRRLTSSTSRRQLGEAPFLASMVEVVEYDDDDDIEYERITMLEREDGTINFLSCECTSGDPYECRINYDYYDSDGDGDDDGVVYACVPCNDPDCTKCADKFCEGVGLRSNGANVEVFYF